tara:strand:- start:1237 stop:1551 length:315 start_codon:yes stop_codon:yes gene_type:complete
MNLIKQNQLYEEIMDFYSNECKKTREEIIQGNGSDKILKTIFIGILKNELGFNTTFIGEKMKCTIKQIHTFLVVLRNSRKIPQGLYKETYDYAKEKILKEFKND